MAAGTAPQKFTVAPIFSKKGTLMQLMGLGTPTQPITLHLNPTTPDFFVVPTTCKTTNCLKNRGGFDTSKSSTFDDTNAGPFATTVGGTQSTGRLCKDALTALAIPGRAPPIIPLPLVESPNGELRESVATGTMGWGFLPNGSPLPATFLQGMLKNLDFPAWEVYYQSYTHTKKDDVTVYGNVTYGNKDAAHCNPDHFFLKTDNPKAWELKMDYAKIGNVRLRGGRALIYPGSPRIHAPATVVAAIRKRVHAKYDSRLKEYVVDCKIRKKLPMLRFVIHKKVFAYFPREYLVQSEGTQKCLLMIAPPSKRYTGAQWILGDPIMREHCIYFDFNGPRIGFTKHKGK
ncbi:Peptidase A1 domain-containing protein [Aphelenchoides fujianensis]|nr:Peptidase A1 domain-containing protein [Aphelenchoides fujianensis]